LLIDLDFPVRAVLGTHALHLGEPGSIPATGCMLVWLVVNILDR